MFGFDEWPFAVVPDAERAASLWADRREARAELDAILADWRRSRSSSLHLIWADLGAGKTHTLMHLRHHGLETGAFRAIYALLPNSTTSFVSLYSSIVAEMDWAAVAAGLPKAHTWVGHAMSVTLDWLASPVDAVRRNLASRWLRADRLSAKECERLGVPQPLKTVDDAVEALTMVINALSSDGTRVVLMIDEYQRVAEGTRRQLQKVGHGVHTVFNACPKNLSLILSCASGGSDVEFVLTPELVSRLSLRRIDLPYLDVEDVAVYLSDLFAHYRSKRSKNPMAPFTDESVRVLASYLIVDGRLDLTPRGVNDAFDYALSALEVRKVGAPYSGAEMSSWLADEGADLLARIHL